MFRKMILTVMLLSLMPFTTLAQDGGQALEQQSAKEMAFGQLSEKQQKLVVGMLKKLFKEGKVKAEESIRESGSFVPYGYVLNNQADGQFLHINPEQKMKAEVAAHAVQKTIVTNALRGNLAASGLFMTMALPDGLNEKTREQLEDAIKGGRGVDDVRFLMVELQHLGGLGMLMSVPYWKNGEGQWVFGDAVSQQVTPELHRTVRQVMANRGNKG